MDTYDGPQISEWSRVPRMFDFTHSEATPSHFSTLGSPMPTAGEYSSINTGSVREIEPFAASLCERLTREISRCDVQNHPVFQSLSSSTSSASSPPLAQVLRRACTAIQYHAKWFAPAPLTILFHTALNAAYQSSSTADLYGALDLIDTIGTYLFLPDILPPAKFIAFAYYQGSRSNRHKQLSLRAWRIAERILDSHLGNQFAGAMLEIISIEEQNYSKSSLCAIVGALMLTTEQLLQTKGSSAPIMNPTQLLLSVQSAAMYEHAIVREQTAIMLGTILYDDALIRLIEEDAGLEITLRLVQDCLKFSLEKDVVEPILDGFTRTFQTFEPHLQPAIAQLFVDMSVPLSPEMSAQYLFPWRRALLVDELSISPEDCKQMIEKLSATSLYLSELEEFVDLCITAPIPAREAMPMNELLKLLESLITNPCTPTAVSEILGACIARSLLHYVQIESSWEEVDRLLSAVYFAAQHSVHAADVALRTRADISNHGYINLTGWSDSRRLDDEYNAASHPPCPLSRSSLDVWATTVHDIIKGHAKRWDISDTHLTHLVPQLCNHALWQRHPGRINPLIQAAYGRLNDDSFLDPPVEAGVGKSHMICQLIKCLSVLLSYHCVVTRKEINAAIVTLINIAGSRDHTVSIQCIHALTICCYELPELMAGYMDAIISKMSKLVTQKFLAIYVLEFLAGLSRLPDLQKRLRQEDFKRIFGVCHSYLQSIRGTPKLDRSRNPTSDPNGVGAEVSQEEMAQFVYALAHHVIAFWYMALNQTNRHELKDFITSCLKYKTVDGAEHIEDQGLVTVDLMDRVDAEEQIVALATNPFDETDGRILVQHRVTGLLLITTETSLRTSKTLVTIRRPSGTSQRTVFPGAQQRLSLSSGAPTRYSTLAVTVENAADGYISIFPDDDSGRTYGKVLIPQPSSRLGSSEVITLPINDEFVARTIRSFDRTSALDSHKAGVIYMGEGQTTELEIFMNQAGSPDYREFLDQLGSVRKLQGAEFNTQGLDRSDNADGEHTIVWNNDVTELVYHITTFMPTDFNDAQLTLVNKKKHIGNDFVNIVFNNSGVDFRFDTFPSAFNYVYIVITPSDRTSFVQARTVTISKDRKDRFYNVHVLTRPGHPNLSSASDVKVVSGVCLGGYIRNLALNACVFATMRSSGVDSSEYPSSWRQRLHMIRRLYGHYEQQPA